MSWWGRRRLKRAAKIYGRRLPATLREGWGSSETYTPGQIAAAIKRGRLNPKFAALGYAAFMSEEQFNAVHQQMPVALGYAEARALFFDYLPIGLASSTWEPGQPNAYVMSGGTPPYP
jgi:hypothetical protein